MLHALLSHTLLMGMLATAPARVAAPAAAAAPVPGSPAGAVAFAASNGAGATGSPERWSGLAPEQRAALLAREAALPLRERLLRNSARFLQTPYVPSPLGEGGGVDPDPTLRLDAVDCLTFVEQTLALSMAATPEELAVQLERLRYAARPSYEGRNHLMEAQWLPNNLRNGFLEDVTRRYGAGDVVRADKELTAYTWSSRTSTALQLPRKHQPRGVFSLDIIPLQKVMAHARTVPSGTLLLVVRDERPLMPTRVTHLGFVVQKRKRTYLRHAARNGYLQVVDEDLETFLTRNSRYATWPVTGVSLYELRRPGALPPSEQTAVSAGP